MSVNIHPVDTTALATYMQIRVLIGGRQCWNSPSSILPSRDELAQSSRGAARAQRSGSRRAGALASRWRNEGA